MALEEQAGFTALEGSPLVEYIEPISRDGLLHQKDINFALDRMLNEITIAAIELNVLNLIRYIAMIHSFSFVFADDADDERK